jgi:2-polyprenyl-3-methyl-5-hydroxy-6-metoxy-1,4-benzoquinol methylase
MRDATASSSMERWLQDVRSYFCLVAPGLLALFDTYEAEAIFGRRFIDRDLEQLPSGARVLEVGAGSMLLSCQLVREGFEVAALEPVGSGFSHFDQMRQLVLERADALECRPRLLNLVAEDLNENALYDFAFSINVMEHVGAVSEALTRVCNSLKAGATYRFTCPNYLFPYEPHFNLPTLLSKRLTAKILRRQILGSQRVPDPAGTWESLNWINVLQVRRIAGRLPWLRVEFNRRLLVSTLERIACDRNFAERRSPAMRALLLLLVRSRLHLLLRFVPAMFQPIIDCRLQRLFAVP